MGGTVSTEDAEYVDLNADGSMSLKPQFQKKFQKFMPDYSIMNPIITPENQKIMKDHWALVLKGTNVFDPDRFSSPMGFFYDTFYGILFKRYPPYRVIFRSSMTVQGKALGGLIGALTRILEAENIVHGSQQLALRHAGYGTQEKFYYEMGSILMETLMIVSGNTWSDQIGDCYLAAYCFLLYLMLPTIKSTPPTEFSNTVPSKIVSNDEVALRYRKVVIEMKTPLRYCPGDAVMVSIPGPGGKALFRHFSITNLQGSREGDTILRCVVDLKSDSSRYVGSLKPGAKLDVFWIQAPLKLELDQPSRLPSKVAFIAYETNVAPFIAMVRGFHAVRERIPGLDVSFIHFDNHKDRFYPRNELSDVQSWDGLKMHFVCTGDATGHNGPTGNLSPGLLTQLCPDIAERTVFFSGPNPWLAEFRQIASGLGIPEKKLKKYEFDNDSFNTEAFLV